MVLFWLCFITLLHKQNLDGLGMRLGPTYEALFVTYFIIILFYSFSGFCHVFGRFSYVKSDFTEMKSLSSGTGFLLINY